MKERPILFSTPMVKAILDGRKTMTRRVVKRNMAGRVQLHKKQWHIEDANAYSACPYGIPGDRLWVRETWRIGAWDGDQSSVCVDYKADGLSRKEWLYVQETNDDLFERLWTQSTDDAVKAGIDMDENGQYSWHPGHSPCRWRPSIFMPRWASRITLEITNVRVERLQDISVDDIIKEGLSTKMREHDAFCDLHEQFIKLWDSINGKKCPWASNPFVWVVEFKRVEVS